MCGAASAGDATLARLRCVAEAVERYAAVVPRTPSVQASGAELAHAGQAHLRPYALGGDVDPRRRMRWLAGARWSGEPVLVPYNAALGTLSGAVTPPDEGVYPQGSTGLAAGADAGSATAAGADEVVERHLIARAWYTEAPLPRIPAPASWRAALAAEGIHASVHLAAIEPSSRASGCADQRAGARADMRDGSAAGSGGEFDTAGAVLVCLRHPGRELIGVGAAYRKEPRAAVDKAMVEAVVSLAQACELADPSTGPDLADAGGLAPYRPDRRYADSYGAGYARAVDIAAHTQLYLDPRLQKALWERLSAQPELGREPDKCPPAPDVLAGLGGPVAVVDLTPPDGCGLVVCRVLAPGARTLRPAAVTGPSCLPSPLT